MPRLILCKTVKHFRHMQPRRGPVHRLKNLPFAAGFSAVTLKAKASLGYPLRNFLHGGNVPTYGFPVGRIVSADPYGGHTSRVPRRIFEWLSYPERTSANVLAQESLAPDVLAFR